MKHISIIIPRGAILGSLEGTRQLLTQANTMAIEQGGDPVFNVQLVGLTKETPAAGGIYDIKANALIGDVKKTDLIIIPALDGNLEEAIENNRQFIPWLIQQKENGAEIATLCVGAFLLAATGMLDGKKCATHWLATNAFRSMFPNVNLVTEKIITDEHGFYSSGGAFSYLSLILHLIEKFAGRDMKILIAKVFAVELERENQLPFVIFQGQKDHNDTAIRKAQEFIEKHYQEKITIEELAKMVVVSRRNFERRFKKATANTVAEYIQRVKIEAAKMTLESTMENVNDAMYKVGYNDPKAFRVSFKKITGLSPVEYRNKYRSIAV